MKLRIALMMASALAAGVYAAEPGGNTLRWKARETAAAYGYLIYRSDTPEGPFRRINARIIPKRSDAAGNADAVIDYDYVDHDVREGGTYYYRIDGINQAGVKKQLSPVLRKTVGGMPVKVSPNADGKNGGN